MKKYHLQGRMKIKWFCKQFDKSIIFLQRGLMMAMVHPRDNARVTHANKILNKIFPLRLLSTLEWQKFPWNRANINRLIFYCQIDALDFIRAFIVFLLLMSSDFYEFLFFIFTCLYFKHTSHLLLSSRRNFIYDAIFAKLSGDVWYVCRKPQKNLIKKR